MKVTSTLFMSAMIRALLAGTKTQTRRAIRPQPADDIARAKFPNPDAIGWLSSLRHAHGSHTAHFCPYGQPGDLLIVREDVWMWCDKVPDGPTKTGRQKWSYQAMREAPVIYRADHPSKPTTDVVSPPGNWGWRLKLGRFMPRYASRLTLSITEVRVQRLKDICGDDCIAEGAWRVEDKALGRAHEAEAAYMRLWDEINGPGSSDANPWVWAITFEVIRANVDSVIAGALA